MATRTRLSPEQRREQLLAFGVAWIADKPFDELSLDLLAEHTGVSRGLLYHYFGGKQEYQYAVLQRLSDDLFEATAPVDHPDMVQRMRVSLENFVRWVREHRTSYEEFLAAARGGGSPEVAAIYARGRDALTDRIFESATTEELAAYGIVDSAATRLFARGWATMVEDVVRAWLDEPGDLTEDAMIDAFTLSLGGILGLVAPLA
ncbi:TetR/AcrR family transcriptional regulator [Nocardioides jiangxiensis]|uniref:TetR/AcrR family transcriptional regulator n=1 Tax=Nocardioides jiangxiensis TaxID=3064524 RepID=A0ABT9B6I4_9ACTN|nr:TetR/AcrR family transcriptional regulator [Nocardioides sp. WY-20]MDO7868743.1 TetR/AcrR family transcriptional regulator [Nocardioides sp. WY-20]